MKKLTALACLIICLSFFFPVAIMASEEKMVEVYNQQISGNSANELLAPGLPDVNVTVDYSNCETSISLIGIDFLNVDDIIFDGIRLGDVPDGYYYLNFYGDNSFNISVCPTEVHEIGFLLRNGLIIKKEVNFDEFREDNQEPAAEIQGIKTFAFKKALKLLSRGLRSNSLEWILRHAERNLASNRATINAIRRHSTKIANKLDDLARWEDVAFNAVENQVTNLLIGTGVQSSVARNAGFVVRNLIWLFL